MGGEKIQAGHSGHDPRTVTSNRSRNLPSGHLARMDPYDQELLSFARRWEPFGGPSNADIFIEFGMTPERFSHRLDELLRHRRREWLTGKPES